MSIVVIGYYHSCPAVLGYSLGKYEISINFSNPHLKMILPQKIVVYNLFFIQIQSFIKAFKNPKQLKTADQEGLATKTF